MKRAEIVIIGGGVVGASVAFHLVERGCRDVLILERGAVQGLGSTGAATGGVRAQFETEINIRMSMYSIDFFAGGISIASMSQRAICFLRRQTSNLIT